MVLGATRKDNEKCRQLGVDDNAVTNRDKPGSALIQKLTQDDARRKDTSKSLHRNRSEWHHTESIMGERVKELTNLFLFIKSQKRGITNYISREHLALRLI